MKNNLLTINDSAVAREERLAALKAFASSDDFKNAAKSACGEINNHIHTIYSFSPYTPAMAALKAFEAGLEAAGSVDHDSIGAAMEMRQACAIIGIGGCTGFEVRVSFKKDADGKSSSFAGKKINNPDSEGFAYMTVQGIPAHAVDSAAEFLTPIRNERLKRTKAMTVSANALLKEAGVSEIDFQRDIFDRSKFAEGGEITERHLLAAAAEKIILKFGKGRQLTDALNAKMGITLPAKIGDLLSDQNNPHFLYDLLGVLKTDFLPGIFIQPDENECIPVMKVTSFAQSIAAIPAYAYLGDVGESPTGDKKAEKFEDDFINELFSELSRFGFKAVTYMPPRNTLEQLLNIQKLSRDHGFMEISGVDINSSRQSFNCPDVLKEEFRHLVDTTWALIAHERLAGVEKKYGLFSENNPLAPLDLKKRLSAYASFGKRLKPALNETDESAAIITLEIEKGRLV